MLRKQSSRFLTCLYICCYVSAGLELGPKTDFEKRLPTLIFTFLPTYLEDSTFIPNVGSTFIPTRQFMLRKQSSQFLTCLYIT